MPRVQEPLPGVQVARRLLKMCPMKTKLTGLKQRLAGLLEKLKHFFDLTPPGRLHPIPSAPPNKPRNKDLDRWRNEGGH